MTAIDMLRQQIKYPRPTKLSDPYFDFPKAHLERILATDDSQLNFADYRNLFGPHLPAGTYSEVIYFLPLAFAYFIKPENETYAFEILDSLVGFTAENQGELQTDALLDIIRECFREFFQSWTKTFTIIHHDKDPKYLDIVEHLTLIVETFHEFLQWKIFTDVVGEFVQQLAQNESDPIQAAWFLAYAADEYRASEYRSDENPQDKTLSYILDRGLLEDAAKRVRRASTLWNMSPTYWYDTFDVLGLDDFIYLPGQDSD